MPSSSGDKSTPSIGRSSGGFAPARARAVWNRSRLHASARSTRPARIFPGHHAMQGTRMPPSQVLPFPSRSSPADPPAGPWVSHGPLSLVKTTSVFSASVSSRSAASICPTLQSSSSTTSP